MNHEVDCALVGRRSCFEEYQTDDVKSLVCLLGTSLTHAK